MADELDQIQEEPKKKGKLKWIIILVLLIGVGGAAYMFKDMLPFFGSDEPTTEMEEPENLAPDPEAKGVFATIPPFVANLNDPLGKRYVKIGIEVELINEEAVLEFDANQIQIKNDLLILLGSKRPQEMLGPQNQIKLQQDIVQRLNQNIGEGKVLHIYFSEYILQ